MVRLVFVLVGFVAGVAIGEQARGYGSVGVGVLIVLVFAMVAVAWFGGQRDKASAVAVAVARAEAHAVAVAESQAAAIAQAAVHLHMAGVGAGEAVGAGWTLAEPAASGALPVGQGRHALTAQQGAAHQVSGRVVSVDDAAREGVPVV